MCSYSRTHAAVATRQRREACCTTRRRLQQPLQLYASLSVATPRCCATSNANARGLTSVRLGGTLCRLGAGYRSRWRDIYVRGACRGAERIYWVVPPGCLPIVLRTHAHGVFLSCMLQFCDDERIQQRCPRTCGLCIVQEKWYRIGKDGEHEMDTGDTHTAKVPATYFCRSACYSQTVTAPS